MGARGMVLLLACLMASSSPADDRFTKQDADRCRAKLTRIVDYGNAAPAGAQSASKQTQSTSMTDVEVNSYLRYGIPDSIPVGIVDPVLTAGGDGRVAGRAVVDLDAVRKQKQRGWLDPMAYLTGRLPITASGRLTTKDGVGQFSLESADINGVSVPKGLVQELLTFYSKSPERPAGINMDDPFELPSHIREIRVALGTATVIQ